MSSTPSTPAAQAIRTPAWAGTFLVLVGALTFLYAPLFTYCFKQWLKPDYSHGFLVPLFSAYLAYHFKHLMPERIRWPNPWGLAFLAAGLAVFFAADKFNIAKEWLQGFAFVLNLSGATLLLGGWKALKWLAPALAFLLFMFPLPYSVEHALGTKLQLLAARASEFCLQLIGYPTYREGVILYVRDHALEVEKACSGLSMLLTFAAISTGMALVVDRPWIDRALILVSAVPVAVLSNVIRITLTGVLYNEAGKELGDKVFHDFAGWMMMPIALVILWVELKVLDWVWVDEGGRASGQELLKEARGLPAHLIMNALPQDKGGFAPPAQKGTANG